MNLEQTWALIDQDAELNPNYRQTYKDIKAIIFSDDLCGCDAYEAIYNSTYHGYALIRDTMERLNLTREAIASEVQKLARQFPSSYAGDEEEWALWDIMDSHISDLVCRDSRIEKRLDR